MPLTPLSPSISIAPNYMTQIEAPPVSNTCRTLPPLWFPPLTFLAFSPISHTLRNCSTFHYTAKQSASVWSRGRPRYLKFATPSTITSPYFLYKLYSISRHLSSISTSLCLTHISFAFSYLAVPLCFIILSAQICIP